MKSRMFGYGLALAVAVMPLCALGSPMKINPPDLPALMCATPLLT